MRDKPLKRNAARLAARLGVLSAAALALSWLEAVAAPFLRLPLGAKPGLSNIAVMLAAAKLGWPYGLGIALVKAVFAGITRGPTAMLLSGAGGLLSALIAGTLLQRGERQAAPRALSEVGVSVIGGVAHNLAQLACAALIMQTPGVLWSAPALIVFGVISGAVTGMLVRRVGKRI
ncbi:MAG: Gx transporter family protein [Oscillospiraceae bacterium]|nr:Gx transporter family protein [Oscillospiraceae bacterium]